jgi:hypothetical protein
MNLPLHPMWIVGFVDGEGCFRASLIKNAKLRFQTQIQMEFVVVQHQRDMDLLEKLQAFFQCGSVSRTKGKKDSLCHTARFRVRKLKDLETKILPFFEHHSLCTKKHVEFLRFRELCCLLSQKVHFNEKGFKHCVYLAKNVPYRASFLYVFEF